MKMDKFCMMFFVIVASIFFISGSASAQAPGDCIECSSCTLFEMWKFICTFIGQICTMQGMPANFCLEQQEICEDNIDDLVTECRRICKNDCNEPENCTGGAPDGNCTAGENCPADATDCDDNICMEPTCTNGCGEVSVSSGSTDEACNATAGCTTPPCSCDGNGGCIGENEGCTGGAPDGNCTAGENCPADATDCDDNICMEPTCINGCGEVSVSSGSTDEACNATAGCTTPPCSCDGQGNCATVPVPGCHGHGNPDWLELQSLPTVLAKEKGCTGNCGTEYLVELRSESHADCGDQAWVWIKDGQNMDIDKCYHAAVFENSAPCGPVIDVTPDSVSCPVCDGQMEECANSACEAANTIVPCACGGATADTDNPWCCAADNAVFSKDSTQEDCKESESCKDGNIEECLIKITHNNDGKYCVGDTMVATHEFYEDGALTNLNSLNSYDAVYYNSNYGPYDYSLSRISEGVYESTGIAGMYNGHPSVMGLGKRIMNIEAEFGNCKEEATTDYTIYKEDSDECKPENPEEMECDEVEGECRLWPGCNSGETVSPAQCGLFQVCCVPDGGGSTPTCTSTNCESSNAPNIPCICGKSVTTPDYPWCCASESYVTSTKGNCESICGGGDCTDGDCDYKTQMYCHHGVWGDYYYCGMCPNHCGDGVCENCGETKQTCPGDCDGASTCTESDGGRDYETGSYCDGSPFLSGNDHCNTQTGELTEYYCVAGSDTCHAESVDCDTYCKNKGSTSGKCEGFPAACKCSGGETSCTSIEGGTCMTYSGACQACGGTQITGYCESGFCCKCGPKLCSAAGGKCMSAVSCQGCDGTQITGKCDSGECCKCTSGACEVEGGTCISPAQCDMCGGTLISGYCASYPCCKCAGNK